MTQFNYLGESLPSLVDRMRAIRVPGNLSAPLLALATAVFVVLSWLVIERHWYERAVAEQRRAQLRLLESRAALSAAKVQRSGVERLLELDRQLRVVRSSGSLLGLRIVDIANRLPEHVWLISLVPVQGGVEINGQAVGMARVAQTITALGASGIAGTTTLVRAAKEERAEGQPVVAFDVRIDE